jgi:glycosyltransferase involved in cell wall biosynthesis
VTAYNGPKSHFYLSKPKILIIGPTPPPYNGMSVATDLVLAAVRDQFAVIHLDTSDRRSISKIGAVDLVNILLAGYHGLRYLALLVIRNPDIVYVPIAQDRLAFLRDCLFLIPARLLRKKLVIHLHGGFFAIFYRTESPWMRRCIRYALGTSDRVIVLGAVLSNVFEGILPQDCVRVVPNGIHDGFKDHQWDRLNGHPPTILFLSTLMREKGVLDVLYSLRKIADCVPDLKAVFAGEWFREEDKEAAAEIVRSLRLAPHVEFIGVVKPPRKFDVFAKSDVFVMPTIYKNEGHPFVILEAMSAGLPVVSTNVGCIPETVIDGETGFIVAPGDLDEFAGKVIRLLMDFDLRKKMGAASRARFLDLYTNERFAAQMRGVFQELSQ